jgi:hypothetical protein
VFELQNGYGGTVNNGTVTTQVQVVPGATFTTQYTYDGTNRLKTASETSTLPGTPWQSEP